MSELIDLTKKVEQVLELRKIPSTIKAQVCLAIDGSGSMQSLYSGGIVQKTVDRISAIAVKFDDNAELDVLVFSNGVKEAKSATPEMFGSYVKNELLSKKLVDFGGTSYSPFIKQVVENYFSSKSSSTSIFGALKNAIFGEEKKETSSNSTSGYPIFCIVITDGENSDKQETTKLLKELQNKDVYFSFIGIGSENFRYIKNLADELPNVGFFEIPNLETVKDMELYKSLISDEAATWINKKFHN